MQKDAYNFKPNVLSLKMCFHMLNEVVYSGILSALKRDGNGYFFFKEKILRQDFYGYLSGF